MDGCNANKERVAVLGDDVSPAFEYQMLVGEKGRRAQEYHCNTPELNRRPLWNTILTLISC